MPDSICIMGIKKLTQPLKVNIFQKFDILVPKGHIQHKKSGRLVVVVSQWQISNLISFEKIIILRTFHQKNNIKFGSNRVFQVM